MSKPTSKNEIKTVSQYHQLCGLPKPLHPMLSVINLEDIDFTINHDFWKNYVHGLYSFSVKRGMTSKLKYGQTDFDFDDGILAVTAPKQVFSTEKFEDNIKLTGYKFIFHPDFIKSFPLAKNIHNYGFFSYSNNKALFLSDKEEQIILNLFKSIEQECQNNLDKFSQEVIIANIELLLVHIDRYYNRQFLTRKNISSDVLAKMEQLLNDYFEAGNNELPTVQYFADQLNLTPTYLSDLLKNLTGLTAQQHIHEKLIEKSKELLTTTNLSVSEIAYQLGFEFPQSFNKLFKKKTGLTPVTYKQTFN
ncbi:AraC-type DNA-binding protein [Flexibacter flexilis DSM 6793]|uniref:AraC-type DNA-binding protein n=1 Tax=Flexibacter flexilis DSM 6793 TaxID=927664 RepID=A0A1I1FCF3_9BACT|nr:AraC family transcriptional regulator [Flexibacter flexilis]SFB96626.1 AraC-type DNA-binding protein [Flexibacter flexilis DSM 6793]